MKRNKFSLSHFKLQTCDMGELVPVGLFEVLPGDTIQQSSSCLIRLSPMLAPILHPVHVRIHHWFVPYRLIWDNFEKFITGGPDGNDATVPPFRTHGAANPTVGSLPDYLGVPTGLAAGITVGALPYRAYSLIWNEWYRDQDLQTELVISKADGSDSTTNINLQKVCWEKDYFTTARPWPQKGAAVTIPAVFPDLLRVRDQSGDIAQVKVSATGAFPEFSPALTPNDNVRWLADNEVGIDLADLREGMALQRYAEARARYGSRYTEYLAYCGVKAADARLQRPEYLGGGRQLVQMSEVLQTGVTTSGTPNIGVAELKGHGIGAMRSNRYRRYFQEHGLVLSLLSVKPKTMYVQGSRRLFNRPTKEDYFQKELQHIGQQEVLNQEIDAGHASPTGVWGYQDRYDEYRRIESQIAGEFRTTLNFWHMARIFAAPPTLNAAFVSSDPTKRIHAVSTNDVLWTMVNHSIQARRMMAKTGTSFGF